MLRLIFPAINAINLVEIFHKAHAAQCWNIYPSVFEITYLREDLKQKLLREAILTEVIG